MEGGLFYTVFYVARTVHSVLIEVILSGVVMHYVAWTSQGVQEFSELFRFG